MKTLALTLLFALCAMTALAADVSGKWTGTFTPEGQEPQQAFIILKQAGGSVTGSGGPDESQQWPLNDGKVDGNKVTGSVTSPDGVVYNVVLVLDGEHLKGDITAKMGDQTMKAKADFTKVKS